MSSYISVELRRLVETRAHGVCEYCLIHEDDTYLGCEVDHIISEKHGGLTEDSNLAYACFFCNRLKGSDVGSVVPGTAVFCRFVNPRSDRWSDHFVLEGDTIKPKTEVGEVTSRILQFNSPERLIERQALRAVGRYPHPNARLIMG